MEVVVNALSDTAESKKRRRNDQSEPQITATDNENEEIPGDEPDLTYRLYTNTGHDDASEALITLKNIFSKQLPKMPKDYIVRLVFDRRHKSLAIKKQGRIIGGICYRPYHEQRFAEIAFCAISSKDQVKGYGTKLMNQLKDQMQKEGVEYFLTYADNYAIGYFEKSGFSKVISMPKVQWTGFIKDYDGGTLMEGYIHPSFDYLATQEIVNKQKQHIIDRCKERTRSNIVYQGLKSFEQGIRIKNVLDIPGVREAGWDTASLGITTVRELSHEIGQMQRELMDIWRRIDSRDVNRVFSEPVSDEIAPKYSTVIDNPMDMSTIRERILSGDYYRTKDMMRADLLLMLRNCKTFNEGTQFVTYANDIERFMKEQKFFVDAEENSGATSRASDPHAQVSEKTVSRSSHGSSQSKRKADEAYAATNTVNHEQTTADMMAHPFQLGTL